MFKLPGIYRISTSMRSWPLASRDTMKHVPKGNLYRQWSKVNSRYFNINIVHSLLDDLFSLGNRNGASMTGTTPCPREMVFRRHRSIIVKHRARYCRLATMKRRWSKKCGTLSVDPFSPLSRSSLLVVLTLILDNNPFWTIFDQLTATCRNSR